MFDEFAVFIVDDDPSIRDALALMLSVRGYRVLVFADAQTFLDAVKPVWKGCLLLDIRMPGMDGLALQKVLRARQIHMPVVIMTGHGDVASAREAFRAAAVDFLEKPIEEERLLSAIAECNARLRSNLEFESKRAVRHELLARLTPREAEVMRMVVVGYHNRDVAAALGISPRTVEVHKARLMDKLGVGSVAELVRFDVDLDP